MAMFLALLQHDEASRYARPRQLPQVSRLAKRFIAPILLVCLALGARLGVADDLDMAAAQGSSDAALDASSFKAGVHYEVIPIPVGGEDVGKIEVVEIFSYGCIHCYNFEPLIDSWRVLLSEDVTFTRLPAVFSTDWALLAQAYYSAEVLGVADLVHEPMFEAIHTHRLDMRQPSLIGKLFAEKAQIDAEEFSRVYNSFSVRSKVEQARARGQAFRITGVPSMVVNGKYRTDGSMAGGNTRMLEVVDFLVERERQMGVDDDPS